MCTLSDAGRLGSPWGRVKGEIGNSEWRYQDVAIRNGHDAAGEILGKGETKQEVKV